MKGKRAKKIARRAANRKPERSFSERVLATVKKIPMGKTISYGEVARRAGLARAAQAVGAILRANRNPDIPCHRVIRADGKLGGYNRGGPSAKAELLLKEKYLIEQRH